MILFPYVCFKAKQGKQFWSPLAVLLVEQVRTIVGGSKNVIPTLQTVYRISN